MPDPSLATLGGQPPQPSLGQQLADAFNIIAPTVTGAQGDTVKGNYGALMGLGAGAAAVQSEQDRQLKLQKEQQQLQIQQQEQAYKTSLGAQAQAAADHLQAETKQINTDFARGEEYRKTLSPEDQFLYDNDKQGLAKKLLNKTAQPYNAKMAKTLYPDVADDVLENMSPETLTKLIEIGARSPGSKPIHHVFYDKDGKGFVGVVDPEAKPGEQVVTIPIPGAVGRSAPKTNDLKAVPPSTMVSLENTWRMANGKVVAKLTPKDEQDLHDYIVKTVKESKAAAKEAAGGEPTQEVKAPPVDSSMVQTALKEGHSKQEIRQYLSAKGHSKAQIDAVMGE
jgi:hypothetical protein